MRASEPLLAKKDVDSKKSLKTVFLVLGLLSLGCIFLYSAYSHDDKNALSLQNEMEVLDEEVVLDDEEVTAEMQEEQDEEQDDSFPDPVMYSDENDDDMEVFETQIQTSTETHDITFTTETWHVNHIANVQPEATACGLAYDRGVGTIPDKCKPGFVKDAGLCYQRPCPDGYKTVAASCIEKCPSGYTDIGFSCLTKSKPKPKEQYIRQASKAGCDPTHKLYGGLCYRKQCREEYQESGAIRCASCGGDKWKFFASKTMCKKKKSAAVKPAKTYIRSGSAPKCPSDKPITAKIGTIRWCYPKCRSGYKSISGFGCQKSCGPGQKDLGGFCQDNDIVKKKDVKVRRSYVPTGCGDRKVNQAGLCYQRCKTGYTGVGPMCFMDLMKFAKKKGDEFANYFKVFNIYQGENCFDTKIEELKRELLKLNYKDKNVGKTFMNILKKGLKTNSFAGCLKTKIKQWQDAGLWDFRYLAFAVEYSIGASFGFTAGGLVGFAVTPTYNGGVLDFSADGIKILGYFGGCLGFAVDGGVPSGDLGADFTFVVYRSMADILGNAYAFGVKAEVNSCVGGELSVGPIVALSASNCQVTGVGLAVGASLSTPGCPGSLSVQMSWCRAEKFGSVSFNKKRQALLYGEKVPVNERVQSAFTEEGPVEFIN